MDSILFHHSLDHTARTRLEQSVRDTVLRALAEDIGSADYTAKLIPAEQLAQATIISREAAVICGLAWVQQCFISLDANVHLDWKIAEGDQVTANQALVAISGKARAMLSAERCALNFLQTLSATATRTRQFVDAIKGTKAAVLDTRKTIPGLRLAQKYAVLVGGGVNQRLGLYDGILIKENHITAAGSVRAALRQAQQINQNIPLQIEVENLQQLTSALDAGASSVLLDNFTPAMLTEAVQLNHGRALLEASGGVDLTNIRAIAETGVDRISVGEITKHIRAIDLSMRLSPKQPA